MTMDGNNVVNGVKSIANPALAHAPHNKTLGQQDFLKLMVAQVKHQNPLEPSTNGDFIAQMAQFSTTDGINKMQESLENLASSFQSNQALQASTLVGRKVMVNGNVMKLEQNGDCKASVEAPEGINNLTASIYSQTGELVRKFSLGQENAGMVDFNWDGLNQKGERMPAGKYAVKVTGNYGGQEVALKTMIAANIDSVSLGQNGEGLKLNIAGFGPIMLKDVKRITG